VTKKMMCPACSGKGYRLLRIRPDEGICPTCGGAGTIKKEGTKWLNPFETCPDCGGRGIRPLKNGGTRDGLVLASGNPSSMDVTSSTEQPAPEETTTDTSTDTSDDESFFQKYRWYFVAGGGGLLVLALAASKASKRSK
jgi:hypothetical protein